MTSEWYDSCHVRDIYQRRILQKTKGPALSLPFSKVPSGSPRMHALESARDRIIASIDVSRSITLDKSIEQVADTDRQQVI